MRDRDHDAGGSRRLRLDELPLLDMRVGLYGSTRHAEVGGQVCFGIVITMAVHAKGHG